MREMAKGNLALFYHSNAKPPGVAGLARVEREAYPDHFAWDSASQYCALSDNSLSGNATMNCFSEIAA